MLLFEPTTALIFGVIFFSLWLLLRWRANQTPYPLPPGPPFSLPFIGHLHLMSVDPREKFQKWRKQYGDIFSLRLGNRILVVMSDYKILKEAFVKQGEYFSDRPYLYIFEKFSGTTGIILASGELWKEHRKLTLEILREFGFGKNVLAEKIQFEVTECLRTIELEKGQPFNPASFIQTSVANIICSILLGKRFEQGDQEFQKLFTAFEENVRYIAQDISILNFIPLLRHLPGGWFHFNQMLQNKTIIDTFFQELVKDRTDNFDADQVSDIISAYIRERKKKEAAGESTTLNEDCIHFCSGELFAAGMETTSSALLWALVFMVHNPKVQEKCYQEIVKRVGTNRSVTLQDKTNLPYTEAVSMEVLRKATVVPFGIQHTVSEDLVFRGYYIPKNAIILPLLDSVLSDRKIWKDPENFRPERFLSEDGRCIHPDEFIPFSLGRRVCLGESLARMELFLFLSGLLQHFQFLPSDEGVLPSLNGILGSTLSPEPYKIRAVQRM